MAEAHCSSCRAPMIWTVTENGRRMPVDAQKVIGGNINLAADPGGGPPRSIYVGPNLGEYVSHFSTCPQSREFRRKR
jgi:hypothetical protein